MLAIFRRRDSQSTQGIASLVPSHGRCPHTGTMPAQMD
jgi:hypothetical protein